MTRDLSVSQKQLCSEAVESYVAAKKDEWRES